MTTPSLPVYLDYAATTPVDPQVADVMAKCLTQTGYFANPVSSHAPGVAARMQVEAARAELARLLNCERDEIIFTSGATESNNLAIKGVAEFYADKKRHIISEKTGHKAVVSTVKALEKQGWPVTWLVPENDGVITAPQVEAAIRQDTVLVALLHANNETGVLNDIDAISQVTRQRGVLLHVDAAQSVGKIP
ncbi:MAG TPA: aminotransferase class V-fold PLP-dependent enzyme, partial [Gammaproteobacteria bacterium]|nr:aminotransferase class V-fold PLP-dependent enzyme [Gammaproteobacteria bacterium]